MMFAALALLPALLVHPAAATYDGSPPAALAPAQVAAAPSVATTTAPRSFAEKPTVGTQATCPVMGEVFTVSDQTRMAEYRGRWYAFCCPGCEGTFKAHPETYADPPRT